jgi:hypothetical protein
MLTRFHLRPQVNGSHEKKNIAHVLSAGKVERATAQADTELVIAQYLLVAADAINSWNICIYFENTA